MAKRVPPSTLVLVPEGGAFHAIEVAAGEDLGADTSNRVLSCIATGEADAGSIATYLGMTVRTVRRHVSALRKAGLLTKSGPLAVSPGVTPECHRLSDRE
jgi:predicted ArsR family transcriptional regulator